ncbi:unnamed protein product [Paramecium sonneborni]|uniref:Uncharacterized protein n=1 Tax=Paramecium sonneborni TaxID=65129 RepID=A0A8S1JYA1_9CILI|nr:unnamed protein product [Paramecium sonneborni]
MVKQLFTEQEKQEILKKKAKEIREEFFQTYVPVQNAEESQKKKLMKKVPWNEHMTATSDDKILIDQTLGNEEAQREVQIYQITFANVQRSIAYLTQEGIPVQRPDDFEVEMFKSPKQMDKIKLKIEKKRDEKNKKEEEKMKKHSKKLNKQMKIKKMREEHKEKRKNKVAIEQWKKEIKEKGSEKARDLDEIIKQNNLKPKKFKKDKNQQQDGIKKGGMFKQKNDSKFGKFKKTGKMRTEQNSFQKGSNNKFGQRSQSSDANRFQNNNNRFEGKPQRSRSYSVQGNQRNNKQFGGDNNNYERKQFGGNGGKQYGGGKQQGGNQFERKPFRGKQGDGKSFGGKRQSGGKSFGGKYQGGKTFSGNKQGGNKSFSGKGGKSFSGKQQGGGKSFGGNFNKRGNQSFKKNNKSFGRGQSFKTKGNK